MDRLYFVVKGKVKVYTITPVLCKQKVQRNAEKSAEACELPF